MNMGISFAPSYVLLYTCVFACGVDSTVWSIRGSLNSHQKVRESLSVDLGEWFGKWVPAFNEV